MAWLLCVLSFAFAPVLAAPAFFRESNYSVADTTSAAVAQRRWPVSNVSIYSVARTPQSNTYGPRLKFSEGNRPDFHMGIDIPCPMFTTLVAIDDGEVVINGSHRLYSDGVVQLRHTTGAGTFYSTYLHVNSSLVGMGEAVSAGQPIALSGAAVSGFPHLHFEIRQGGRYSRNNTHPWGFLPYQDTPDAHTVDLVSVTVVPGATYSMRTRIRLT
jgi:murein DD-endopeptidase MepM/ murein hydrolase activator NlpD